MLQLAGLKVSFEFQVLGLEFEMPQFVATAPETVNSQEQDKTNAETRNVGLETRNLSSVRQAKAYRTQGPIMLQSPAPLPGYPRQT